MGRGGINGALQVLYFSRRKKENANWNPKDEVSIPTDRGAISQSLKERKCQSKHMVDRFESAASVTSPLDQQNLRRPDLRPFVQG